jgi:hypothetical protein
MTRGAAAGDEERLVVVEERGEEVEEAGVAGFESLLSMLVVGEPVEAKSKREAGEREVEAQKGADSSLARWKSGRVSI